MANNTFEAAYMKLKNGMTLFFKDGGARELIDKLKALVDTKYGPDNPPPVTPTAGGRIWYAVCSTASGTGAKTATSSTGDFVLETGNMVRLKCTSSNTASNPTLSVDGSTPKTIQPKSGTSGMDGRWRAQEVIDLVYDGTSFVMSLGPEADTSFYGITKLSNNYMSTSQSLAATPQAVKSVYDIASAAYSPSNPPPTPSPSSATPQDLGTADAGSSSDYSRADHVHNLPAIPAASSETPQDLGTADAGSSSDYSRADHVHNLPSIPTDSDIVDLVYPVGSIYMSVNSTSPASLFGGTWTQIEDTFLLSAGSTYTAGDTGGEAAHKLVANELPKINGSFTIRRWSTGGAGTAAQNFSGVFSDSTVTGSANPIAGGSNAGDYQKISMAFGNDQAHNNMPPYLVVYMWERTA